MPKTLFLIDDDPSITATFRRMLTRAFGDEVTIKVFADGQDALDEALAAGFPDAIVTDDRMPLLSGRELAVKLRRLGYARKIIMISGTADDGVLDLGVDRRMLKPCSLGDLRDAVMAALG